MIEQKEKNVLAQLMQFGYDCNVIALPNMRGNEALEKQFEEMNKKIIRSLRNFYNTSKKNYEEEVKHKTIMRFCFTVGVGAAWFWEYRKEEVDLKGLYECMAEPRGEYEMDEYIEDVVGIWWSTQSHDHQKYLFLRYGYMDIIRNHYDLTNKEQEISAGHVMMLFGMYCGYTRIYHERTIKPYKGEMPWHWEIWQVLHGEEDERLVQYNEWAYKAIEEGERGLGKCVIHDDPDSEYGKIGKFCFPFTYREKAGMKTLVLEEDDDNANMISATPIFDSLRNCLLVIENVYEWENGAEATIEAHFENDEDCVITFYDTNYLENKDRYYAGLCYTFDLYGIAYQVKVVPEEERSLKLEGEDAVNFNKKTGNETDYDENGLPEPVIFHMENLHSFFQSNDKLPEDASFRSPVKAVYNDIDYFGKKVYEVEIGIPYHNTDHDKKHLISVFIAADTNDMLECRPSVGDPVHGVIYLQGKMRNMINWNECPSTMLHSFDAKKKDGQNAVFVHVCAEGEEGLPMTESEQQEFAKEVYSQLMGDEISIPQSNSSDNYLPDFMATRRRDIWVKPDVNYTAATDFVAEDKKNYLARDYSCHRIPVIAYVSLYDINGNPCRWLKGGEYTAKIHYGSVLSDQKMEVIRYHNHDELVEILYESFKNLDTRLLAKYLHKDLDFRSVNLADPIITRKEYLIRTEGVNNANKKAKEGPVKAVLVNDEQEGSRIELNYPKGYVDVVRVVTKGGFITAIKIENVINIEDL